MLAENNDIEWNWFRASVKYLKLTASTEILASQAIKNVFNEVSRPYCSHVAMRNSLSNSDGCGVIAIVGQV